MEKERNNLLAFLNVFITHIEQGFKISVYKEPTFTGQYLNFNSNHPYSAKKRMVHCLKHQVIDINSHPDTFHSMRLLRGIYSGNMLPLESKLRTS